MSDRKPMGATGDLPAGMREIKTEPSNPKSRRENAAWFAPERKANVSRDHGVTLTCKKPRRKAVRWLPWLWAAVR